MRTPSDQQLENDFGTKKDVDVVQQILEKGALKEADAIRSGLVGPNINMGSAVVDTKGKGRTSGI